MKLNENMKCLKQENGDASVLHAELYADYITECTLLSNDVSRHWCVKPYHIYKYYKGHETRFVLTIVV